MMLKKSFTTFVVVVLAVGVFSFSIFSPREVFGAVTVEDAMTQVIDINESLVREGAKVSIGSVLKRKEQMLQLAKADPALFLQSVLPKEDLVGLRASFGDVLEESVTLSGYMDHFIEENFDRGEFEERLILKSDSREYEVLGLNEAAYPVSENGVSISGYLLDGYLVASDALESVLTADPIKPEPYVLKGKDMVLVVPVRYQDSGEVPHTPEEIEEWFFGDDSMIIDIVEQSSDGVYTLDGDVLPWLTLPRAAPVSGTTGFCNLRDTVDLESPEVIDWIKRTRTDVEKYRYVLYFVNHPCFRGGGLADLNNESWVGTWERQANLQQNGHLPIDKVEYLALHELVHNFGKHGVLHANGLECGKGKAYPENAYIYCEDVSHGSRFDVMGQSDSTSYALYLGPNTREGLGWLNDKNSLTITKTGSYVLAPITGIRGQRVARIVGDEGNVLFYLDFKRDAKYAVMSAPLVASNQYGLFVSVNTTLAPFPKYRLVDMRPRSDGWDTDDDKYDLTLNVGKQITLIRDGYIIKIKVKDIVNDKGSTEAQLAGAVSAVQKLIRFDVDISKQPCIRRKPVWKPVTPFSFKGFGNFWVAFYVFGNDSYACKTADFELSVSTPSSLPAAFIDSRFNFPGVNREKVVYFRSSSVQSDGFSDFWMGYRQDIPRELKPGIYKQQFKLKHLNYPEGYTERTVRFEVPKSVSPDTENLSWNFLNTFSFFGASFKTLVRW